MANIFVSPAGNDTSGNGSLENPYSSVQKAASIAQPGDVVKIRGGIYRETVTPANSGTQASPIIIEAYNGENVTVSGADALTSWETLGGDIYRCLLPWSSLGIGRNQLFAANRMLTESRFPFVADEPLQDRSGMLVAIAGSGSQNGTQGNGKLRHPSLANFPTGYWVGGRVNFNGCGEVFETGTITAHSGDEIELSFTWSKIAYVPALGSLFYLWNKMPTTSAFQVGEFFIDGTQTYLKLAANQTPTTVGIEAKRRDFAFNLTGKSWITIRGIKIFAAAIETGSVTKPTTTSGTGILLDNLDVKYPSHRRSLTENNYVDGTLDTGICLRGTASEIRNSRIQFSAGNGITLGGSNNKIYNNVILDCNYLGCDAAPIGSDRIFSPNDGHTISYNTVRGAGRSGIVHRKLNKGQVSYNDISEYARLCSDLAGTYTWGTDGLGMQINNNRIVAPIGKLIVGLYLDNNTPGHIVYRNLIVGSVQINGPTVGVQFYNNTVDGVFGFGFTPAGSTVIRNNIILGGIVGAPGNATISNNCLRFDEPGIENRGAQDYRLRLSSPSINAGVVAAPYTDCCTGSAPDIGCFEFGTPVWVAGAMIDNRPRAAPSVALSSAMPGAEVTRTQFSQATLYQRAVTLSGVTSQVAAIVFDASAALASGKIQADGRDLRVTDSSGMPISFWLDGVPGKRSLLFVRFPTVPSGGNANVNIAYGGSGSQGGSNLSAVFPNLASFNNKLWLAANDGVSMQPNSQVVKKVRDRSGNGAGATEEHTEYKKPISGIPNPNLGADAAGIPAFVFDGTQGLDIGNNFTLAQNQPRTFFVVQRSFKEYNDNCIYGVGYGGNIDIGESVGGTVEAHLRLAEYVGGSLKTVFTPNSSVPFNRTNAIAVISQAGASEVRVQGISVLSAASAYQHYAIDGEFYIGRKRRDEQARWYKGLIYEFIAFNKALSVSEISSIEEYLSLKYLSPTSANVEEEQV